MFTEEPGGYVFDEQSASLSDDGEAVVSADDRDAWLQARKNLVTASDVAALLGANEYKTREQLRLEKAGLADEFAGDEYTDWALSLEPLIITKASEKFGWKIERHGLLIVDKVCNRLGATPDAVVRHPWTGLAQIKVTCCKPYDQVKKHNHQPPLAYQIQVNAELAVTGASEGRLLVLHTFPRFELREYPVQRHEALIQRIREEVPLFWSEVESLRSGRIE
jgi:putative phage-type endonuclease